MKTGPLRAQMWFAVRKEGSNKPQECEKKASIDALKLYELHHKSREFCMK